MEAGRLFPDSTFLYFRLGAVKAALVLLLVFGRERTLDPWRGNRGEGLEWKKESSTPCLTDDKIKNNDN